MKRPRLPKRPSSAKQALASAVGFVLVLAGVAQPRLYQHNFTPKVAVAWGLIVAGAVVLMLNFDVRRSDSRGQT